MLTLVILQQKTTVNTIFLRILHTQCNSLSTSLYSTRLPFNEYTFNFSATAIYIMERETLEQVDPLTKVLFPNWWSVSCQNNKLKTIARKELLHNTIRTELHDRRKYFFVSRRWVWNVYKIGQARVEPHTNSLLLKSVMWFSIVL